MPESLVIAGTLLGGLGLFLLAVGMLSNGLRTAAGRQLRSLLERYTQSPTRGIVSGALITAVVQSSSAVTVATIGFVNAGILNMPQALGVVFGSNVGTTMTGWLVAAVGFQFKLEAFALPLIGVGMFLRLTGPGARRGALGEALAGFGLFFIGVDILRDGFAGLADSMTLPVLSVADPLQMVTLVGIGFLMTVLTQSSSASVAMILTAASGNALPLSGAAAMVIGANIGTTSTAALAVIGATANAKRVAAGHILFNLITGIIALLMLPVLLWTIDTTSSRLGLGDVPAVMLALFHTVFNLLGVLLMWPLAGRLAGFLSERFVTVAELEGRPRHLDRTLLHTPSLADNAIALEITRVADIARRMGEEALSTEVAVGRHMSVDRAAVDSLAMTIADFVTQLNRQALSQDIAEQLPKALRSLRYFATAAELAEEIARAQPDLPPILNEALAEKLHEFRARTEDLLRGADVDADGFSSVICQARLEALESLYQGLKEALLAAGARFGIAIPVMNDYLEQISRARRLTQQVTKGTLMLDPLRRGAEAAETDEARTDTQSV